MRSILAPRALDDSGARDVLEKRRIGDRFARKQAERRDRGLRRGMTARRSEGPRAALVHHAKALDDTLINMADVEDMTDEFATPRRKPGAITPSRWPIGRPAPIGCCRRL